jgi:hypothetical protein
MEYPDKLGGQTLPAWLPRDAAVHNVSLLRSREPLGLPDVNCQHTILSFTVSVELVRESELHRQSESRLTAKLVQLLWIEGVASLARRIPTTVFSIF